MVSYGEAEDKFIRKLFGENIRRRDNCRKRSCKWKDQSGLN